MNIFAVRGQSSVTRIETVMSEIFHREIARRIADSHPTRPLLSILDQLRHIGIMSFLRDPEVANNASQHRRLYAALRTLGRVGQFRR